MTATAQAEKKRCFDCGAGYPADAWTCENDGTTLTFKILGGRWRIESVLGPRPGGTLFSATDSREGASTARVAVDLLIPVPVPAIGTEPARDAAQVTRELERMQRQIQALRILDQHSGVLKLIEEGTERDGARFFVTQLDTARPLQELLDEWQQPGAGLLSPSQADRIARPLLGLLSAAHRLGIAHGAIDPSQIFLVSDDKFVAGLGKGVDGNLVVKLRGLSMLGFGPGMREVAVTDLDGVGAVLCELMSGRRPPPLGTIHIEPSPERRALASLPALSGPIGQVVLRALGLTSEPRYLSAEEMLRALVIALPNPTQPAPLPRAIPAALTRTDPGSPPLLTPGSSPAVPASATSGPTSQPNPASLPPLPASTSGPAALRRSMPGLRTSGQFPSLPAPPVPGLSPSGLGSPSGPHRSGLTGELRQVSVLDLIQERETDRPAPREETLARSRRRPSSLSLKLAPPVPLPEDVPEDEDSYAVVQTEPSSRSDSDSLEPTRDVAPRRGDFSGPNYSGPISNPGVDPGPPVPPPLQPGAAALTAEPSAPLPASATSAREISGRTSAKTSGRGAAVAAPAAGTPLVSADPLSPTARANQDGGQKAPRRLLPPIAWIVIGLGSVVLVLVLALLSR